MNYHRRSLSALLSVLVLLLSAPTVSAATYYVATNGNDNGPGTEAQPWRTVQKAAQTLRAGDTALIRGGVYNESGIRFANSGAAGSPIVIANYPNERAVIDGGVTSPSGRRAVFDIDGVRHIILDGLVIRRASVAGVYIGYDHATSDITIRNCEISDVFVNDNTAAIYVNSGTSRIRIQHNVLHPEHYPTSSGVILFEGNNDALIENNRIYNASTGIYYKHGVNDSPNTPIFRNNIIHDVRERGIAISTDNTIIENNLIYNASGYGIRIYDPASDCSRVGAFNTQIIHNTIANSRSGIGLYPPAECASRGARNTLIRDNLIYNSAGGETLSIGIWPGGSGSHGTVSDFNLVYDSQTSTLFRLFNSTYTLINWRSATGLDRNSLNARPLFVDEASRNYALQAGSPGKNAASDGRDIGVDMNTVGPFNSADRTPPNPPTGLVVR